MVVTVQACVGCSVLSLLAVVAKNADNSHVRVCMMRSSRKSSLAAGIHGVLISTEDRSRSWFAGLVPCRFLPRLPFLF